MKYICITKYIHSFTINKYTKSFLITKLTTDHWSKPYSSLATILGVHLGISLDMGFSTVARLI